ncbi:UBP-type zinc finger domain-containing protein [Mycobacteroides salmoniphilum]|uniref:UBP-type zinc finger domain-containing protein n=1 Tax=Mycobacteroides salmoniphilum TaxID=404941 RepID=UPI000992D646|nr:UBP-type zinc finger domain-containing protein [Mycobacteroides salmoniphilum]QCH25848.1 Zn-finger in ubiquitin-hydrolases and other protein [Mycobacteroides salmoniphilum]
MKRLFRRGSAAPESTQGEGPCPELAAATGQDPQPRTPGQCEDCAALGEQVWAHLRLCLECGRVSCCDSSPHQHATAHFHASGHPVMRSHEPGEDWRWCYVHSTLG